MNYAPVEKDSLKINTFVKNYIINKYAELQQGKNFNPETVDVSTIITLQKNMDYDRAQRIQAMQKGYNFKDGVQISDIAAAMKYLENIKVERINLDAKALPSKKCINMDRIQQMSEINGVQRLNQYNVNNQSQATRNHRKSDIGEYNNPYEYGASQNQRSHGMLSMNTHVGPYDTNGDVLQRMGIPPNEMINDYPRGIRNVNVETPLLYGELGRDARRNEVTMKDVSSYQFNSLPFDPQNVNSIVWMDNMPRGGVSTRTDRLENF